MSESPYVEKISDFPPGVVDQFWEAVADCFALLGGDNEIHRVPEMRSEFEALIGTSEEREYVLMFHVTPLNIASDIVGVRPTDLQHKLYAKIEPKLYPLLRPQA